MLTPDSASNLADRAIKNFSDSPPRNTISGRGIVICGGGIKYGACAWVLIRLLRHLGCELPIEVWCLNYDEYDPHWIELVQPFGVTCVNAQEVQKDYPHRCLKGWQLKPYAILHSRFQEVLFLDADNVPIHDPSYLFDMPEYQETGTVFWPDPQQFRTYSNSERWRIFGTDFVDGPDQESGQILVDKARCWKALSLCNWYNEHSDFYYKYVYGDKDTFRFAWLRLGQPISWPSTYPSEELLFTLVQHDCQCKPLFQHRFYRKWHLFGGNTLVPNFKHEGLCLKFLEELKNIWQPELHLMSGLKVEDHKQISELVGNRYLYNQPGHNRWPIRFGKAGRITEGYGPNEHFWWCEEGQLVLVGIDGQRRCELRSARGDRWIGEDSKLNRKLNRKRIELLPI